MYLNSKYDLGISYNCQKINQKFCGVIKQAIDEIVSQGNNPTKKAVINKAFEIERR